MTHTQLRQAFLDFWQEKGHVVIPPSPLMLQNDATTLFTSAGMQPLVPFLAGEKHPKGTRLCDVQPCIRTQDIEEVGDTSHTTFFEMMGNWSLGEYFKEEQLAWKWDFFTRVLGLDPEKLYVTIFAGYGPVAKDEESRQIWKSLGVADDHIFEYGTDDNWWSRSGDPDKMPENEIGGPSSEVFFDFGADLHEEKFGKECHPNCDCSRFLEIGNSVFITYQKKNGQLVELAQRNVDFGGGLERILAAMHGSHDIFTTDIFAEVIAEIAKVTGRKYDDSAATHDFRVLADHMRAAVFLMREGILPSNKEHGYVLRRMIRRSILSLKNLADKDVFDADCIAVARKVVETYQEVDGMTGSFDINKQATILKDECLKFQGSLKKGLAEFSKLSHVTEENAFNLYQNYGFPFDMTDALAQQKGIRLDAKRFDELFHQHKDASRTAAAGRFKGGLSGTSDNDVRFHTATHLLHQALKDVLGPSARQEGSNITAERLRFDAFLDQRPTEDQLNQIINIMNQKIQDSMPVYALSLPKDEAEKLGAESYFREKYGDIVSIYFIGGSQDHPTEAYSKEFCGGPHVENTSQILPVRLKKMEKIGASIYRFYIVFA